MIDNILMKNLYYNLFFKACVFFKFGAFKKNFPWVISVLAGLTPLYQS